MYGAPMYVSFYKSQTYKYSIPYNDIPYSLYDIRLLSKGIQHPEQLAREVL